MLLQMIKCPYICVMEAKNILQDVFDVIIIGGSYAGLSAAMALGRSLRKVLVVDSGLPCNRQTPHSHNFVTQDGVAPAVIAQKARQQVLAYDTVRWVKGKVTGAAGGGNEHAVMTEDGNKYIGRRLLFATGIRDKMPELPGFAECWGISVLHCPYCHGYEVRGKQFGVLARGDMAFEYLRLLRQWSRQLVLFTDGPAGLQAEHRQLLENRGIAMVETPLAALQHAAGQVHAVLLADGSQIAVEALFNRPAFEQHCSVPAALGCVITEQGYIQADEFGRTVVPGVLVAGDNASMMRSVAAAVAAGNKAGAWINKELAELDF